MKKLILLALFLTACALETPQAYDPISLATQAGYQGNNALATISSQQATATRVYAIETEIAIQQIQATNQMMQATHTQAAFEVQQYQVTAAVSTSQAMSTVNAYAFQSTASIEDIYKGATATAVANLGLLDSSMIYLEATRQSIEFDRQASEIKQKNLMLTALIACVLIFVLAAAIRFILVTRRQTTPVVIPEQPGRVFVYGNGWQGDREQRAALPAPIERPLLMEPREETEIQSNKVLLPVRLPQNAIGVGITKGNGQLWFTQNKLNSILGAGEKGAGKSNLVRLLAYQAYMHEWQLYLADAEELTFDSAVWGKVACSISEVESMLTEVLVEFDRRLELYREAGAFVRENLPTNQQFFVEDLEKYNKAAKLFNMPSIRPAMIAIDEANNLLGGSNTLDKAFHEILRRSRKTGFTVSVWGHSYHASQIPSPIYALLDTKICMRVNERTSRVVLGNPTAAQIADEPGLAIMRHAGKDMRIKAYFLPAQRILEDIKPIEGEWEEISNHPKSRLESGDRERIIEMFDGGASQRAIEKEIFNYNGGTAWELVKDVIESHKNTTATIDFE